MDRRTIVVSGLQAAASAVAIAALNEGVASAATGFSGSVVPARPTIRGPITGGKHGWHFGASARNLNELGYVEEEYFLSGHAMRYRAVGECDDSGRWKAEPTTATPYVTRIYVRRPRSAQAFSGIVFVEWANVSAGFEVSTDRRMIYDGHAYVSVSAQRVGVHGFESNPRGLTNWDDARYGQLSVSEDTLSYDIFSQALAAVGPDRAVAPIDPMAGLSVKWLIAMGTSQSSGALTTYFNAIQPLHRLLHGLLPAITFGRGLPLETRQAMPDPASQTFDVNRTATSRAPTRFRDDLGIPVFVLNTETEAPSYVDVRQPDTDRYRFWEVAGASHVPPLRPAEVDRLSRDGMAFAPPAATVAPPSAPAPNDINWTPVFEAAMVHIADWVKVGRAPPIFPRIQMAGSPPHVQRDANGNALGGIRLPDMTVPISTHTGQSAAPGMGALMGTAVPFSNETLRSLYPDRTTYLTKIWQASAEVVASGVVYPLLASEYVTRAETANIGA